MMTEAEDLNLHALLCEQRYKALEGRLDAVEQRLSKVEDQIADIKQQMHTGFSEIKVMLERNNSQRQTNLVATIGSIVVAVIGVIGYLVVRA
jgi:predicted  nucleic acid-binding Zn-ribbon protein